MAPNESVEIRLVCKADYLDPQLKTKLHEIRDKLKQILHTGRRRFALKKVQPWNSVKVTFVIPKEAADQLRLLAAQGNIRLIELGILSVEIAGQSNAIVVNSNNNNHPSTTTSNSLLSDIKSVDHRSKRIKIENETDQQPHSSNLMQSPSTNIIQNDMLSPYLHQHERDSHSISPTTTMNSGATSNSYLHDDTALSNGGNYHHDSWSGYKMKINRVHSNHYYPSQYDMRKCETTIPQITSPRSNTTSTTNLFGN